MRGEAKEKEMERNSNVWLPLMHPQLGTWPKTQACTLTGNWTSNPLVLRPALSQSTEPQQPGLLVFSYQILDSQHPLAQTTLEVEDRLQNVLLSQVFSQPDRTHWWTLWIKRKGISYRVTQTKTGPTRNKNKYGEKNNCEIHKNTQRGTSSQSYLLRW